MDSLRWFLLRYKTTTIRAPNTHDAVRAPNAIGQWYNDGRSVFVDSDIAYGTSIGSR